MFGLLIFIVIASIVVFFLYKLTNKEILHPIIISSLFWIIVVTVSVVYSQFGGYYYSWSGIIPILLLLTPFTIGCIYADGFINFERYQEKDVFNLKQLRILILFFSFFGIWALKIQMNANGLKFNINDILRASNIISVLRYNESLIIPRISMVLAAFLYSSAFFSGIYFLRSKSRMKYLIVSIPFGAAIFGAIVTGSKSGFLMFSFIWAASACSYKIYLTKGKLKNKKRYFRMLLYGGGILYFFFMIIHYLRSGRNDSLLSMWKHMASYLTHYNPYSIWWENYDSSKLHYGKYTFAGIHNIFFNDRKGGIFTDTVDIGNGIISNIYTIIRGLFEDYSILGSMILMFFVGVIFVYVYRKSISGSSISIFFTSVLLSILFWSSITSIVNYNVIIFSFALTFTTLIMLKYIRIPRIVLR